MPKISERLLAGGPRDTEMVEEIEIDSIKISGKAAANLKKAADKRGAHPKQVMADIIHYVLTDNMIDAVLDD